MENDVTENEIKNEIKFKQNIGMSVDIAFVTKIKILKLLSS